MSKRFAFLVLAFIIAAGLTGCYPAVSKAPPVQEPSSQNAREAVAPEAVPAAEAAAPLKVVAAGDIMLSANRAAGVQMAEHGYKYPFEGVKDILSAGDITFANMECPISTSGKKLPGKGITFRADPAVVDAVKYAGIDVLSLANNHILDYDDPALLDTLRLLDGAGIYRAGAGENIEQAREPAIVEKNGLKMAFLAYSDMADIYFSNSYKKVFAAAEDRPGVAPTDIGMILEDVRAAKQQADIVAVSLHWGVEDSNKVTDEQIKMAHSIIDAGADVILGHHPHVLQGVEIYNGKVIAYSLANLVFDQLKENNKQSMILEMDYEDGKWVKAVAYPVYMEQKGHPVIASGDKREEILNKIVDLSASLGTKAKEEGDVISFDINS